MSVKTDSSAKVRRIHVIGYNNTRVDFLESITSKLFDVKSVAELLSSLNHVRQQLASVGIFSHVRSVVDVAKDNHGNSDPSYEVTYIVRERRRTTASLRTELETNGVAFRLGGRFLNATGRADQAVVELIRGTHSENGYAFGYSIPVSGDTARTISFGFGQNAFENCMPFLVPFSTYRQRETSVYFGHEFPLQHRLPWKYGFRVDHIWRRIEALQQTTPFPLRTLEGDSVKSSLRHFFSIDTRDSSTLPSSGFMAKFSQELAIPPGDARAVRHEVELQIAHTLRRVPLTLHASFNAGHLFSLTPNPLPLPDRYFIGGPLTLRGFSFRGVGLGAAQTASAADNNVIGGSCFWVGALHAYAPLPFLGRPSSSSSSLQISSDSDDANDVPAGPNPIQLHAFLTAGDLALSASQLINSLARFPAKNESAVRISAGAGVVMRIGSIARLELNYTVPLRLLASDSSQPGFQFGIGVQFV